MSKHSPVITVNDNSTRKQILDAAIRQFSRFGFSKVAMHDIAADIGMGKATLYYYFPTKEELFRAVIENEHNLFLCDLVKAAGKRNPATKKIRKFVEMKMDNFYSMTNLNIVDFQNWHAMRPFMRETYQRFADEECDIIRSLLKEGVVAGEFRVGSVEKTAQALMQVLRGMRCHFLRSIEGPAVDPEKFHILKKDVLFVVGLLVAGLKSPDTESL